MTRSADSTPTPNAPAAEATGDVSEASPSGSIFGRYARLPALAGPSFLPIAFLARLPLAMLTVGALTLLTAVSGSYAIGGFAAGAVGIGSAIGAPAIGYFADRAGQRPVLLISAVAHTLSIGLVLAAAYLTADFEGPEIFFALGAALLMGATCPQVGPLARVRWMAMTRNNKQDLDTALSYESTADELTFVLGPALVGLLAALVAAWLPFALAATLTLVMVSAFAVHPTYRSVQPLTPKLVERHPQAAAAARKTPVNWGVVIIPVAGMIAMGTFFGATQNALNAFGGSFGAADTAGLLYAVLGLSSAVTALSVAYWSETFSHASRWIASAAAMAVLSLLLFLPTEVVPMLVVLLLVGLPVGPTMVTIFTIGGKVAPDERLGTVMTLLASGVVLGSALGSGIAGAIAETSGYRGAFAVAAAASVAMLAVSILGAILVRKRS